MPLEIAVFNLSSAKTALHAGAHRLELCTDYAAGGLTPSLDTLRNILKYILMFSSVSGETVQQQRNRILPKASSSPKAISPPNPASPPNPTSPPTLPPFGPTPIHVMIRPRPGDFVYSAEEFAQMRRDVESIQYWANGFVFGVLTPQHTIDVPRNRELVALAHGLPCTFHRAFDACADWEKALEDVVACGFESVLTSGGGKTAVEGVKRVGEMRRRAEGRISVIVGGGVRSGNLGDVVKGIGLDGGEGGWVHSAAITGEGEECDGDEIRRMVRFLKN